jgi:transposase
LVDATGIPLAVALTGGNRNDVTQLMPLLEDLHARPVAGKIGRPRRKPDLVIADRGYDHDKYRRLLWARGIKPVIARRRTQHGSGLGRQRWVVERGFAHLHNFRRLRIRYERYPQIHTARRRRTSRDWSRARKPARRSSFAAAPRRSRRSSPTTPRPLRAGRER